MEQRTKTSSGLSSISVRRALIMPVEESLPSDDLFPNRESASSENIEYRFKSECHCYNLQCEGK